MGPRIEGSGLGFALDPQPETLQLGRRIWGSHRA